MMRKAGEWPMATASQRHWARAACGRDASERSRVVGFFVQKLDSFVQPTLVVVLLMTIRFFSRPVPSRRIASLLSTHRVSTGIPASFALLHRLQECYKTDQSRLSGAKKAKPRPRPRPHPLFHSACPLFPPPRPLAPLVFSHKSLQATRFAASHPPLNSSTAISPSLTSLRPSTGQSSAFSLATR